MRIGLAYNQRPNGVAAGLGTVDGASQPPPTLDAYVEWDEPETINAVADALSVVGDVVRLEAVGDFPGRLRRARVDFLFNMAEGSRGPNRESQVPAIAEFLGVPYSASDPLALALSLHKGRAKEIWAQRGIPTAPFFVIESSADLPALKPRRRYPMFLKPAWEGSSKGICQENYCAKPGDAVERVRYLLDTYQEPVLAETYLPGEEFTAAILGNERAVGYPRVSSRDSCRAGTRTPEDGARRVPRPWLPRLGSGGPPTRRGRRSERRRDQSVARHHPGSGRE